MLISQKIFLTAILFPLAENPGAEFILVLGLIGFAGGLMSFAFYMPVFISDLINFIRMGYGMLFGFDIDYSISTMTKFLGSLFMMGIGMGEINNMLIWLGFLSGGALGLWVVILTLPFTLPFLLLSRN